MELHHAELSLSCKRQQIIKEIQMSKTLEIKIGSTVYDRINAVRMSQAERQVAINAMRDADLLVDAFVWVSKKVEQMAEGVSRLFLKHSLKH